MTDGITTGWNAGVELLGWLLGFLGPLAATAVVLACLTWVVMALSVDIPHYLRVRRVRRQARGSGRTTG